MITFYSSNIGYDYQLLFILYHGTSAIFFKFGCSLLNLFVYFQRICCLGFTISAVVIRLISGLRFFPKLFHNQTSDFSSAILSNSMCIILERLVVTFYCAAVIFTSLLFFFRTRAVFNAYPWMVAFFAGLWLAVLGGCVALIVNIFEPIPESASGIPLCIKPGMDPFVAASTIIPLINDTLVFLAISWRLSRNSYYPDTLESGIRLLIFGDYLPVFSKALLQDGQAYYLLALSWSTMSLALKYLTDFYFSFHRTVVTMNIIAVFMLFYPSNPDILRSIFTVPNVVLMNVMAGRVFRNTKLFGGGRVSEISTSLLFQEM